MIEITVGEICMTVFLIAPFRMSFRQVRNTVSVT